VTNLKLFHKYCLSDKLILQKNGLSVHLARRIALFNTSKKAFLFFHRAFHWHVTSIDHNNIEGRKSAGLKIDCLISLKEKNHRLGWALRMYSVAVTLVGKSGFEPSTS